MTNKPLQRPNTHKQTDRQTDKSERVPTHYSLLEWNKRRKNSSGYSRFILLFCI